MVDFVSAEAIIKELYDESEGCFYPEDVEGIKQRYKDTALVLFKEQLGYQHLDNRSYLSFGTRRSSTVSEYGNTPIIIRKSRSENGELSKVGQQWPSQSRQLLSDCALLEAGENEEEEEKDDISVSNATSIDDSFTYADSVDGERASVLDGLPRQNSSVTINKKIFSQYDTQIHKSREYIDSEEKEKESGENCILKVNEDDNKDAESVRTVLEVEGVDHKILLIKSTSNEDHTSNFNKDDCESDRKISSEDSNQDFEPTAVEEEKSSNQASSTELHSAQNDNEIIISSNNVSKSLDTNSMCCSLTENCEQNSSDISDQNPLVLIKDGSHEKSTVQDISLTSHMKDIALEEESYVSIKDSIQCNETDQRSEETLFIPKSSSEWQNIELRIVEPSDFEDLVEFRNNDIGTNSESNLESTEVNNDSKTTVEIHNIEDKSNTDETTLPCTSVIPTAPKRRTKLSSDSSPPSLPRSPVNKKKISHSQKSLDENESKATKEPNNALISLPHRSPTPPKKSPRRSHRAPKNKEKTHERHSSLDIPIHHDQNAIVSEAVSSASPSTKSKDSSRIFSFSLRKEKSKSISSLSLRRNKDKEKIVRSESEDPNTSNGQYESSRKRVGVRSMVIDGTIKRNFIVIHPSDESDTIGLAPLSSFENGSRSSGRASKALSSVKSHITGFSSPKSEKGTSGVKKEITRKISSKQELKEQILNTSRDVHSRESLNSDSGVENYKVKTVETVKHSTSHVHGSSTSLSGITTSRITSGSSTSNLVNVSSKQIKSDSTNVSRLCIVM